MAYQWILVVVIFCASSVLAQTCVVDEYYTSPARLDDAYALCEEYNALNLTTGDVIECYISIISNPYQRNGRSTWDYVVTLPSIESQSEHGQEYVVVSCILVGEYSQGTNWSSTSLFINYSDLAIAIDTEDIRWLIAHVGELSGYELENWFANKTQIIPYE